MAAMGRFLRRAEHLGVRIAMDTSQGIYLGLVAAVAAQRIWELRKSARNTAALLERGGREVGSNHYPIMAALHTTWLFACAGESFISQPAGYIVTGLGVSLLVVGQALRLIAIRTLKERWTTRIIVLREATRSLGVSLTYSSPQYPGSFWKSGIASHFRCWYTAIFSVATVHCSSSAFVPKRLRSRKPMITTLTFQTQNALYPEVNGHESIHRGPSRG